MNMPSLSVLQFSSSLSFLPIRVFGAKIQARATSSSGPSEEAQARASRANQRRLAAGPPGNPARRAAAAPTRSHAPWPAPAAPRPKTRPSRPRPAHCGRLLPARLPRSPRALGEHGAGSYCGGCFPYLRLWTQPLPYSTSAGLRHFPGSATGHLGRPANPGVE